MKTLKFLTVALAGLAIVSCSNFEPAEINMAASDQLITFDTPVVAPATKAIIEGTTYPTTEKFKVAAVWTSGAFTSWTAGTTFFGLTEVSHVNAGEGGANSSAGSWTTASPYYWPKQGNLTFIAYSPSTETAAVTDEGIKFENYAAALDGTQADLLYSDFVKDQTKTAHTYGTTYDGVQIPFNHALSSLVFKLSTTNDYTNVVFKVKKLTVKQIKNNGTFSNKTWTPSGDATDFEVISTGDVTVTNTAKVSSEETNMKDVLIIPQTFTNDIEIYIEYTIAQNGGEAIAQTFTQKVNALTYYNHETARESSNVVPTNAFEQGKKYIFDIQFALDQIYFSPEVTNWTPVYSQVVTVN